jgi:hypothetical protein
MLLRPGSAGSDTLADHKEVLAAALRQVPARLRRRLLVRVDGAGASHELVKHLLSLSSPRRNVLFTCGWMITEADEDAIRLLPAGAWKPGTAQDGSAEEDKDVAEITHLMSRAENWPGGLRWIVRRVKPSRRQMKNLTAYEKKTGWRYSITCTNVPDAGIDGVPGSHHPQYTDVLHREHACVETAGVRTAKAMGLRGLPSKTWQVNCGWVIAANIAADLAAWTRLLGHCDDAELRDANPDTLPGLAPPRETRPPRTTADPRHQPRLAMEGGIPRLLAPPLRPARTHLASTNLSINPGRRTIPARSEPVRTRAHRATRAPATSHGNGHKAKNRSRHNQ